MNIDKILSINEKKNIINDVSQLSENQQLEVFNILNLKKEIKFTENKNGVFINLDDIDNESLNEIVKYISFCKESNKVLEKNINSMLVPPEPSNINSDYNNIIINNSISKIIQKESDNLNDNDNNIHYKIKKISNEMNELLSENSDDEHCDNNISDSD
jgi:hypothetical protein